MLLYWPCAGTCPTPEPLLQTGSPSLKPPQPWATRPPLVTEAVKTSPVSAAEASFAWQHPTKATSPVTWSSQAVFNRRGKADQLGHDTVARRMLIAFLTFQVSHLQNTKEFRSDNRCVFAVSCPCDLKWCRVVRLYYEAVAFAFLSDLILLLSGDVELNPGPDRDTVSSLSQTIKELKEIISEIRTNINELREANVLKDNTIAALTKRISVLENDHQDEVIATRQNDAIKEIALLKAESTDTNNRMRCNNLIFLGLEDNEKETWKESEEKIINFCASQLELHLEPSAIERAHRIGKYRPERKRPIIVKLTHFKSKENILACGRKLKATNFAIREDFAPATRIARSKLLGFIRPQKCAFKLHVDKLLVNNKRYHYDPTSDSVIEATRPFTKVHENSASQISHENVQ
ncbi:uncharacterized protein [Dermacentor andersoni]|uniref:uncharacterized protein n=1 Tax=Dermacentor andersoni TaxID=34620 RepID=UPI003B3AE2D6